MNEQNGSENVDPFDGERLERIWLREICYIPLGERALARQDYEMAVLHLREAVKLDPHGDSSARSLLGNALLWQGQLHEAYAFLDSDARGQRNPVSFLLGEWCRIAILARGSGENSFLDALDLADTLDDRFDQVSLSPRVGILGNMHRAMMLSLRRQPPCSLLALRRVERQRDALPIWYVLFWKALVHLSLGHEDTSIRFLQQALQSGMPPVLQFPLYLESAYHPQLFREDIVPALRTSPLPPEEEER